MEEEKLVCLENCPHLNKINNVKSLEPKADEYQKLSNMFKLFITLSNTFTYFS